jgi:type IV pilus assembly protein PilC
MFANQYLATVRDESQQVTKRIVYAGSQSKAEAMLQREKYRVLAIEKRKNPTLEAFKRGKLELGAPCSKRDLATFSQNLALMVATKVNTAHAFQILAESTPKERFRRIILDARKRIMDGESISQSFANFPQAFDEVFVAIVQASETSGQLPVALKERSKALKRSDKVLRKLKNAMIYPIIVLLLALGAVMTFSILAVPALANLYKGTGVELPFITRVVVMFSNFLRASPLSVLGVLAIPLLMFIYRKKLFMNPRMQRFSLKTPLIRDLISKGACLRILQLLHQFSTANVTMPKQLYLCQKAAGQVMFAEALERIRNAIQTAGIPLSEAFKREPVFPLTISGNIQAGEATGSLPEVLEALNEYYVEDLDDAVTRFTAALEPIMIIFLSAVIGTLVIAMYMPLFNLVKILNPHKY